MRGLGLWIICLIAISLRSVYGAPNDDDANVKLVTTGQIQKVDAKNKVFQFKFRLDQPQLNRGGVSRPFPPGGGRRGGIGGRRGRIGGYPRGPQREPVPNDSMEVKVYTSEATKFKDSANALHFSDLRAGDRVTITATHHGHGEDLNAVTIVRN